MSFSYIIKEAEDFPISNEAKRVGGGLVHTFNTDERLVYSAFLLMVSRQHNRTFADMWYL